MVENGLTGRLAALAVVILALGAPLGAMAQIIPPNAPATAEDEALWGLAQGRGTADAYRSYLSAFPNGAYAPQARARLGQLQAGSAPITAAPLPAAPQAPVAPGATGDNAAAGQPPAAGTVPAPAQGGGAAVPPQDSPQNGPQAETALNLTLEERRAIQSRLTLLGHNTRGIDGTFGSGTRRAISAWQASRGHAATGYLTAAQAQELRTGTPALPARTPTAQTTSTQTSTQTTTSPQATSPTAGATTDSESALELTATQKRIIQSRLTQLGHDTRGIDGAFGSGTRRAITAWQEATGRPATGYLTRADADDLLNAGTTPAGRPLTEAETAQRAEAGLDLTRDDRTTIQRALVAAGHDTRGVDGTFGSGTRRAIRDWQAARGAPATGFLTAEQGEALRGAAAPMAPSAAAPSAVTGPGGSADSEARLNLGLIERVEVQARLSALGYDLSGIDGQFGSGTRRAISAWQGDNGLAATGYLTAEQLATLRAQRRR